jgi:hypothetical protein
MDAAVYAERKAEKLKPIFEAAQQLDALTSWTELDAARRSLVINAAVQIRTAAQRIATLGDRLLPYSDPDFYANLPPSRATEDQGQFAASGLEIVFSE